MLRSGSDSQAAPCGIVAIGTFASRIANALARHAPAGEVRLLAQDGASTKGVDANILLCYGTATTKRPNELPSTSSSESAQEVHWPRACGCSRPDAEGQRLFRRFKIDLTYGLILGGTESSTLSRVSWVASQARWAGGESLVLISQIFEQHLSIPITSRALALATAQEQRARGTQLAGPSMNWA